MGTSVDQAKADVAFGRYTVSRRQDGELDVVGEGGMGRTYRGFDPLIKRPVAIKVLRTLSMGAPTLLRESQIAGRITHPNVAAIYDVGEQGGETFIVMEWVDGLPLSQVLAERGALTWKEALSIGAQLAAALHAGHAISVVHRDVKPANILLVATSSPEPNVKLIDFGIAKPLDEEPSSHTLAGHFQGTPIYSSPEQLVGGVVTDKSDLYSLGVTIYQLCSGSLPYKGSTTALYNQIVGSPLRLDCLANAPSGLQEILTRMLSFDPEVRPTAEETAAALGRIMADSDGSSVSVNRRDEETMICQVFQAADEPASDPAAPLDALASDQQRAPDGKIPATQANDAPTIDFAYRLSIWLVAAAGFYFLAKEWSVAGWVAVGVLLAAGLAKLFFSGSGSAGQS